MPSIAFDCDGTLVDSEPLHNQADVTVLARHGIVLDPEEHRRRATGIGRAAVLRTIEQEHGVRLPADTEQRIEDELHRLVVTGLKPIASVLPALTTLAGRGARMAIASNSNTPYIEHALQACGLAQFFGDRIASSGRVRHLKPAPDIYLLAAHMLETPAGECIALDDSVAGIVAAHAAGMRAIGFCPPGHVFSAQQLRDAGASTVIDDFARLPNVI